MICKSLNWIETCREVPTSGLWFICKIKSSDNLELVCGYENVTEKRFDAWAEVRCPF